MTKIKNPLLEEFEIIKDAEFDVQWKFRNKLLFKYSFAIPDSIALEKMVEFSPIIEIGAGLGYWAGLVNKMGGKVLCYDDKSWGLDKRHNIYTEVLPTEMLNYDDFSVCTLFLCWPPVELGMSEFYLQKYIDYGGKRVIYVGEDWGGSTANDAFFEILKLFFKETFFHRIPSWQGINDSFYIFEKK